MSQWPKISIITACLNSEKTIEDTIRSVVDQTYPHIEFIIVDGQSTDRTLSIIRKYQSHIARVISEPDQGVYDAFNKGIEHSTGDVLYFLNSDDYLTDQWVIEEVAQRFYENDGLKIVYGKVKKVDEKSGFFDIRGQAMDIDDLKKGKMMPHQGMFVKRELFQKYGSFDLQYKIVSVFDRNILFLLNHFPEAEFINRVIAVFRIGGISSSLKNKQRYIEEHHAILSKYFGESPLEKKKINTMAYYRRWLELLLFEGKNLSEEFCKQYPVKNIAIFGSKQTAVYLKEDFEKSGVTVRAFLDNNSDRQGNAVKGVLIHPSAWLKDNYQMIDAVILSFENDYEDEMIAQINTLIDENSLKIVSWKQLVLMNG